MRSRISLFALLLIAGSLALPLAAHAAIPFFGPIIPDAVNRCAAGWGMLIVVINNIIQLLITLAIVFVAPLMIAWAGFLFVVNPVNAAGKEQAKKILWNTVIGIVIALAGWMIVDAIMAVLYHPSDPKWTTTWSDLIRGDSSKLCIPLAGSLKPAVAPPPIAVVPGLVNGFAVGCSTSNDQNVTTLTSNGVAGHSTNNCCIKTQSTCTSLDGMNSATLSQIINVENKCGAITVTGGTEVGHSGEGGTGSHSSGAKVDIGQNLISCILGTTGSSPINPPSFGLSQARDNCGNIYTWEGNHTDIYVQSVCAL